MDFIRNIFSMSYFYVIGIIKIIEIMYKTASLKQTFQAKHVVLYFSLFILLNIGMIYFICFKFMVTPYLCSSFPTKERKGRNINKQANTEEGTFRG